MYGQIGLGINVAGTKVNRPKQDLITNSQDLSRAIQAGLCSEGQSMDECGWSIQHPGGTSANELLAKQDDLKAKQQANDAGLVADCTKLKKIPGLPKDIVNGCADVGVDVK